MQERKQSRSKARVDELRKKVDASKLVGDYDDLLPFQWRTPMTVDERTCSKVLREMAQEERQRNAPAKAPVHKTSY